MVRRTTIVPLIGLTCFIALAVSFVFSDSSLQKIETQSTTGQYVLATHITSNIKNMHLSDKEVIDCSFFSKNISPPGLYIMQRGILPSYFPSAPPDTQECGSIPSLQATYFTSSNDTAFLFTYYKHSLPAKKCYVSEESITSMNYSCPTGSGIIRAYTDIGAFTITFHPR